MEKLSSCLPYGRSAAGGEAHTSLTQRARWIRQLLPGTQRRAYALPSASVASESEVDSMIRDLRPVSPFPEQNFIDLMEDAIAEIHAGRPDSAIKIAREDILEKGAHVAFIHKIIRALGNYDYPEQEAQMHRMIEHHDSVQRQTGQQEHEWVVDAFVAILEENPDEAFENARYLLHRGEPIAYAEQIKNACQFYPDYQNLIADLINDTLGGNDREKKG